MFSILFNDETSFLHRGVLGRLHFKCDGRRYFSCDLLYFIGELYFGIQCILVGGDYKKVALIFVFCLQNINLDPNVYPESSLALVDAS